MLTCPFSSSLSIFPSLIIPNVTTIVANVPIVTILYIKVKKISQIFHIRWRTAIASTKQSKSLVANDQNHNMENLINSSDKREKVKKNILALWQSISEK